MKSARGNEEEQRSVFETAFTHVQAETIAAQDLDIATTPGKLKIMEPTTPPFEIAAVFRRTGKADTTNESVQVSSASSAHAKPLQIMKFDQESAGDPLKVVCHEGVLKSIVDKTGDRPIVVLAIAGPMRQGKSFYLNFILRRLHGTTNETEPLHGFKWRGNNDPVTDGIWMWSEPFTLKSQLDGSAFDILLMDTQGVFDEETGEREWSILMGLSLLTSSVFLYNTVNNINDNDLQLLSKFLSFGEMALQDQNNGGKRKPFQNLVFLVRDWNSESQFPFGSEGGNKFIQNKLKKKDTHQKDNSLVRDQLEKCFHDISCILLPHPGREALRDDFNGSVASCDSFVKEFNDSVDHILFQGKLPPKTINGNVLKGSDIFKLFTSYTKLFNEDDFLTPESLYYAQAKACNATVVNTCISDFVSRIKTNLEKAPVLLNEDLDQIYKNERQRAVTQFEKSKKMGSRRLIDEADNDLCSLLKSEFSQLKSSYIAKRQQSISKAQNMAIQQYVTIMESILKGDTFHSNEILQETSKSAQTEAISLFCSSLKLKTADDLASEKGAISELIKSKFQDFLTRNDAKRAQAEDQMRQEVETFRQSFIEQMKAKIKGRILPDDKLGKYHAKIASPITKEFTRQHSKSPLLSSNLQLLSNKIETEYENLRRAMSSQKEEAVQSGKDLLFKAVAQYKQKMMAENPKEYNQFQKLHSTSKNAVSTDFMNSQAAGIPTEILAEIRALFESEIGKAQAEFLAGFTKKLAQSQKEMDVAKEGAKAQYKKKMKTLISDQNSVLTDSEFEREHGARWKKAIQLMDQALQQNCLPLNDTEKESAKEDLSNSIKQVFSKMLHQNARKREEAEKGIGAGIDILSKEYAGELKSFLADNDKNGTEVNVEELHTRISSKIEEKLFQLHHNSPLYAKGKQNLIDKLSQQRDTILKERVLQKKSRHEKFTKALEGALHNYITAMEELNKGSGTDESYQNAHEENMALSIEMFRKYRDPSSSSQIAEKYENNLTVLINESFTNSFAEFKQNKINLVEAIEEAKESAKAVYTQAMEAYFQESREPFSEAQFLAMHNQEKKDAKQHFINFCQTQKTIFQNNIQEIENPVLIELGKEINSISEAFGKRNKERKLQIRQDLENKVIPHVETVFTESVLNALACEGDLVSAEQIDKCQLSIMKRLTEELLSPFKSYAYKLRLELLEQIVTETMRELQQAHNAVQVSNNKNNELVDAAFSHYKNKMIDVLVSGCEKNNFESAHLSVSEEAHDILRKSAATAPNHFLDKLKTQIQDFRKEMHEKSSEFASRMSGAVEDAVRIYTQGLTTYIQSRRYVDEAEITSKHHPSREEAIRSLTNDLQKLTLYSKTVHGVESGGLAELEKRLSQILAQIQDTNLANKEATEERMEASVKTITEEYIVDINLELQTGTSPSIEQVEMCNDQIYRKSMDKFARVNSKSPLFPKWNDVLKEKLQNELEALQHQITAAQEKVNRDGEALVLEGITYYCENMSQLIKEDEDNFERAHLLIKKVTIDLLKKSGKNLTLEQTQVFANELEAQIQIAYEGFSSKIAVDRSNIQTVITKFKEKTLRNYEDKMMTFLNEKTVQISDQKLEEEHNREMKIAQKNFDGLYNDIETSSRFFKDQQRSDVKDLLEKIQTLFKRMKELSNQKMTESKKQLDATITNLRKQYVQNMIGRCGGKIVLGKEFEKLHISVTTSCFDELGRTWSGLYLFEEGQKRLTNEIEVEKNKLASEMKAALDKIHTDLQTAVTAAVQMYTEEMNKITSEDHLALANAHKHHEKQAMDSLKKLRGAQNATYFDKYEGELQREIHSAHVKLIEVHHRSKTELESSLLQAREKAKKFYETEMNAFFDFIPDYIDPRALEDHHKLKATAATEILKEKYKGAKRLSSHDQDKEKADFEDLGSSIRISYNKFQMVNNERLRHLHDELKELQRSIKHKYTQYLKTLAEEAANEDDFIKKNADAITAFGKELRTKLEERNAEKEFITDLLNDMRLYIEEQMPDYFKMFESKMAQNKTNVRTALIEARKYYNEEMNKRVTAKPWFKPEELARMNSEVINLSITKCQNVTLTPEQENQLREAMAVVYQKYSEDNTLKTPVKNPAIGIDLGTTYSCVGVYIHGEVKIIPNRDVSDATTIPSYVTFNKDRTIDVGEVSKSQAFLYPQNTIFDAKRLIGRSFSDPIVQEDIKLWPFSVINDNDKPKIKVFDKQYRPEDISAKILSKLKKIAESYLHQTVKEAVVTVPAYFNDAQRQATRDAAEIAGLKVKILNEPTAAAIAYKLHRTDELKRNVLIFDLGGGTFDVAVLEIKGKDIVVKATGGDTHLGGEDFDNNIVNHMIQLVNTKFNRDLARGRDSSVSEEKSKASGRLRRLRDRCEAAKRSLSDALATVIAMDSIDDNFDLRETITREEFENLNMDLFTKCIDLVEQSLKDAKVEKTEIDDIVLIGGSTRIPKVQELLKQFFDNKKELNGTINADEAVARGAAIQAALLHGEQATRLRDSVKLTDVTPLSLGTDVMGGFMSVIIPKHSKVPCSHTKTFLTTANNQSTVDFPIFEGEKSIAIDNNNLGRFVLKNIPPGRAGQQKVQCTMKINDEGILNVKAVCVSNNVENNITIEAYNGRMTPEEIIKAQTAEAFVW